MSSETSPLDTGQEGQEDRRRRDVGHILTSLKIATRSAERYLALVDPKFPDIPPPRCIREGDLVNDKLRATVRELLIVACVSGDTDTSPLYKPTPREVVSLLK